MLGFSLHFFICSAFLLMVVGAHCVLAFVCILVSFFDMKQMSLNIYIFIFLCVLVFVVLFDMEHIFLCVLCFHFCVACSMDLEHITPNVCLLMFVYVLRFVVFLFVLFAFLLMFVFCPHYTCRCIVMQRAKHTSYKRLKTAD